VEGAPGGLQETTDVVMRRCLVDEFKICGDHCKQVVEIVRDAARELSDRLHLLALVKLLLDRATRFQGLLVFGDVAAEDRKPAAGRGRLDRVPAAAARPEDLERAGYLIG